MTSITLLELVQPDFKQETAVTRTHRVTGVEVSGSLLFADFSGLSWRVCSP